MKRSSANKTVFITGGSRGIGRAAVQAFAQAGDRVFFTYRDSAQMAAELTEQLCGQGWAVCCTRADVGRREEVDAAVALCAERLGPVEVLINNAGVSAFCQFQDITDVNWHRMLNVHVDGAFFCTQAVLPDMLHVKQGVILNVSSAWGITGGACEVHYSTAKAALIGFTKSLAKELGPSHIRVNCIAPGVIDTDMNDSLNESDKHELIAQTPLGRLGSPYEIAQCMRYLCSDASGFITGQVISPNGGFVI
ncbi:MAG: elongation factor P 5-aminopentanone reductase [Christensenellales bacterium]|jgi:3-oxoacyl-[acyl-carrier protein] reductase